MQPFSGARTGSNCRLFTTTRDSDEDASISELQKRIEEHVKLQSEEIQQKTKDWLESVVIGFNLCPFAERPLRRDEIKIEVLRGNDIQLDEKGGNKNDDDDKSVLLTWILDLLLEQKTTPGTTLVVCPELFPDDFLSFWEVVQIIENGLLVDHDLVGTLQVAPFHPLFEFARDKSYDEMEDDEVKAGSLVDSGVDNWTNRSPYPTIHILREDEVSRAVDRLEGGDAANVWKSNVNLLHALYQEMGGNKTLFDEIMKGKLREQDESVQIKVRDLLKKFRLKVWKLG